MKNFPSVKTVVTTAVIAAATVAIINRIPQAKAVVSGESSSWWPF